MIKLLSSDGIFFRDLPMFFSNINCCGFLLLSCCCEHWGHSYFFRDIALRLWVKIFEVLSTAKTETSSGLIFHRFLIKCSLVAWSYLACSLFPWIVHPCPHHGLGFPLFMWNNYARVKLHRQALTIIAIAWLISLHQFAVKQKDDVVVFL